MAEFVDFKGTDLEEFSSILHSKAQEGLAAIEELKGTMEQIAASAEESAGAAEESLSSVTQIKRSSQYLESETNKVFNTISDLKEVLDIAQENINDTRMGMERTLKSASAIILKEEKLFESGKKISEAVELITKLSKRISILALNAAIEATRAKDTGKSFTIMASEIREMAAKSNIYASNVKDTVKNIQDRLHKLHNEVEKVDSRISAASKDSEKVIDLINEIVEWMSQVSANIKEVLSSVEKVAFEIEKLHQGAEVIAEAAEKSAVAVNSVTETVGRNLETFAKVEEVAEEIKSLIQSGDKEKLKIAIDTISNLTVELRASMEKLVAAFDQIEQAALISKEDAANNATVSKNSLSHMSNAKNLIIKVKENMEKMSGNFETIIEKIYKLIQDSKSNVELLESRKGDIVEIKAILNLFISMIRKIELSIVQIAALSINGAVEAARYGNTGAGFSEVSKDIKKLAAQSEEHLDRVFRTINEIAKETDSILLEVNNVLIYQNREVEKLQKLEFELRRNYKAVESALEKIKEFQKHVEESYTALEQAKIASDQINEAAQISLSNISQSKEAAEMILGISKDLENMKKRLSELCEV
ncbi:methyl-accepting chemotaxis protein [Thermovibrio guaymasensis]|uniref:Methyl-accepting chemotaxis protein n=1 Tax=Thermovibrio guaymasensis TaxID=240167 RepID=A0A420W9A2_9BACT|nr:methyl-accepting chemotaxis protein [Thermovibrio guaymasensis]RKQ63874.1 methyl-accepting chemotaxis protein [Thermovibrio guaymasensis]